MDSSYTGSKAYQDLAVEELAAGYVKAGETFTCIFCGEAFEEGVIYRADGRMVDAQKAAKLHVQQAHGGAVHALLALDKDISGLTDVQKTLLAAMLARKDNKSIAGEMGISLSTVRGHKFQLQKTKRQSRIFLALMQVLEDAKAPEAAPAARAKAPKASPQAGPPALQGPGSGLNSLHPFFTQKYLP